jgi:hypothetical protein
MGGFRMSNANRPRLTTSEAAQRLNCKQAAALLLLQAANVTFTRNAKHGSYFWDAAEVEHLAATLGRGVTPEGGVE